MVYYEDILKPMLEKHGISHELHVTKSETSVDEFISDLDTTTMKYTDFVMISGDGIFSQIVNAIAKHPQKDNLLKTPLGFLPGGSANWLSCALSGYDPYSASENVIRGDIVKGDVIEVTLDGERKIYTTGLSYGYSWDVLFGTSRKLFGKHRYLVSSLLKYYKPQSKFAFKNYTK